MTITRDVAMQLWMRYYGYSAYAEDFDGGLMYRDAYGDPNYYIVRNGERIYCGWNVHHVLPLARGGTDSCDNLICTNIITNEMAADKITYWIDDTLYQVKRIAGTHSHKIVRLT